MGKKTKPKQKKKKNQKEVKYAWCIAYINRDFIGRVQEELNNYNYDIETYIPTVNIIKKKFKGKDMFELVPLLFNYGFFKIKYTDACNPEFLMELRTRVTCIYGWVKDPAKGVRNINLRANNQEYGNALPTTALATDAEIAALVETSSTLNIYSAEELDRFKVGDYIQLKGYPFDNMPAKLLEINHHKKSIRVELQMDALVKEITVSFENVFYTVYQGHDDSIQNNVSFDESESKGIKDKLMFQSDYFEHE